MIGSGVDAVPLRSTINPALLRIGGVFLLIAGKGAV
jgi:hypothetical protein